jgi:hypothetical protein
VVVEEALCTGVPVLMIHVKGDLPNLFLSFADSDPSRFVPWVNGTLAPGDERSVLEVARSLAEERRQALASWDLGGDGGALRRSERSRCALRCHRVSLDGALGRFATRHGEPFRRVSLPPRSGTGRVTSRPRAPDCGVHPRATPLAEGVADEADEGLGFDPAVLTRCLPGFAPARCCTTSASLLRVPDECLSGFLIGLIVA